jgi:hypothetical protein
MEPIPLVQAANYTRGRSARVNLVVLHDMEAPESHTTAESVARYFQNPSVQASCHYGVDDDSIVQSVREEDTAWHTPGVNSRSIGIEHAGYASQSTDDWRDVYSTAMLERSAQLCADICKRHGIPPVYVDEAGVAAGKAGITMHRTVTYGLRTAGGHTDPGPNFPLGVYVARVAQLVNPPVPAPAPTQAKVEPIRPFTPTWSADVSNLKVALVTVQPAGFGLGIAEYDFGAPLACLVGAVLNGPSPNDGDGWWEDAIDVKIRAQVRGTKVVVTGAYLKSPVGVYVSVITA